MFLEKPQSTTPAVMRLIGSKSSINVDIDIFEELEFVQHLERAQSQLEGLIPPTLVLHTSVPSWILTLARRRVTTKVRTVRFLVFIYVQQIVSGLL